MTMSSSELHGNLCLNTLPEDVLHRLVQSDLPLDVPAVAFPMINRHPWARLGKVEAILIASEALGSLPDYGWLNRMREEEDMLQIFTQSCRQQRDI
jgi:hypothetical protein